MAEAITKHQPPVIKRRRAKFYYLTQADEDPPMFVFFVNDAELVTAGLREVSENQLRKLLGIKKAPLAAVFRSSHEKKEAERPLTNRAPRLGKSRRDMEVAKVDQPAVRQAWQAGQARPARRPPASRRRRGPKPRRRARKVDAIAA